MSKKDLNLTALHARIVAGELTKRQAADEAGLSYAHLCVKLSRAGLIDSVRTRRAQAKFDSPAMEAAVQEALATPDNACNKAQIARKHRLPAEQYVAFASRVLHAKRAQMKKQLTQNKSAQGATSNDQTEDSGATGTS